MDTTRRIGTAGAARSMIRGDGLRHRPPTATDRRRRRRAGILGAVIAGLVAPVAATAPGATLVAAEGSGLQTIPLESVREQHIVLGDLAGRTQQGDVMLSGIGPYTVRGHDDFFDTDYEFVTDMHYDPNDTSSSSWTPGGTQGEAWSREGDERALTGSWLWQGATTSYLGRDDVMMLKSQGTCVQNPTGHGNNRPNDTLSFCSVFGPEVYSQPFDATVGQSVSFDWAAVRRADDYEIYAFLVEVAPDGQGGHDYGDPSTHSILAYGRGENQGWTTASGEVPKDGTYRFRFVNGSYDQTGGFWLGSEMYVDSVVKVGLSNPIDFPPIGDKVAGSGSFDVTATAPGGPVTFTTTTPSRCSVTGNTVTVTGSAGTICTIVADQAGDGVTYVPASSVARSFNILAAPTAPTNNGAPYVSGSVAEGNVLTGNAGSWSDGGAAISGYDFQWRVTNGGSTTDIAGQTGTECFVVASPGSQISLAVTATNSVGSTTATSSLLTSGFTCGTPEAPTWVDDSISTTLQVGVAYSDGVAASGAPAPTYSISAGQLPAGLSLDASTGALTGTPTTGGEFAFTITASNGFGGDVSLEFAGTVVETASWDPDATVGDLLHGAEVDIDLGAGGTPAPTYSVSAGELPDGLTLDPATGRITGTPTGSGPYDFTVTADNGIGEPVEQRFQGVVNQAPAFSGEPDVPTPQVGHPYTGGVSTVGHPAPTYSVAAGALPEGLVLDTTTGQITGTPTGAGPYSFTITAANGIGEPVSETFIGVVTEATSWPAPPAFGDLRHGEAVELGVSATGTPAPTYSVTAGALPEGLVLDTTTGQITGTPTGAGPYSFTITAANGIGDPVAHSFTGSVDQAPAWETTPAFPAPRVGTTVSTSFSVIGHPAPTFTVSAGSLPAGLSLDPASGAITGTPTTPGSYAFTVSAGNGIGDPVTASFDGTVTQAAGWTTTSLSALEVGAAASGELSADGYPLPSYAITAGKLPAGLKLNATSGVISGTPTTAGPYTFTVSASNGVGAAATISFSGIVNEAPSWGTADVPTPSLGQSYTGQVTASGTPAPVFAVTAGKLPAGLSLNAASGRITGTPTQVGPYSFTITATNGIGTDVQRTFSGTIADHAHAAVVIDLAVGAKVGGATFDVEASGLKPSSKVSIELHSDPIVLAVRTTDAQGGLSTTVSLPNRVAPGQHHIVVVGTTPLGETLTVREPLVVDLSGARAPSAATGGFTAVDPVRVLDTRGGAALPAGSSLELDVDDWGLPATAAAVTVNVTAVEPAAAGYLTVTPCGSGEAEASVLNFAAGQTIANMVVAAVDGDGQLCITSTADTHLLVDLNGVHTTDAGDLLSTHAPVRVLDTRVSGSLEAGQVARVEAGTGVSAAVLNLTVTDPQAAGYLTAFPCGGDVPEVSNLNFVAGQTVANHANVKVGEDGGVCLVSSVATHVVADLTGGFGADGTAALGTNVPGRMLDTRPGAGLTAGETRRIDVAAHGAAPSGTEAVALNVTVTAPAAAGYLTVFPCDDDVPEASNVNFVAGASVANHATVALGDDGAVCVFVDADAHVVVDVQGAYRTVG